MSETYQLTYTTVVILKNGKLKREELRLVQRVLVSLNMLAQLLRFPYKQDKCLCCLMPRCGPRFGRSSVSLKRSRIKKAKTSKRGVVKQIG